MVTQQKTRSCSSQGTCSSAGKDATGCATCKSKETLFSAQDEAIKKTLSRVKHVIFVMSGKGGVGKSSVTVNVAVALTKKDYKVGILDIDLHGPSIPGLLGLTAGLDMDEKEEKLIPAAYLPNLHVLSIDSLLHDKDTAVLWRGPKKTSAIKQFISDVEWGDLDFLLIDSPPGTGDEHMTLMKTIPEVLCLVVTTPQQVSLADVRKAMNFLEHSSARVLGVVENMSGLSCPHCGEEISLFTKGGGEALARTYKVPFLGAVAIDPLNVVAADMGIPVILLDEPSKAKNDFIAVTENIIKIVNTGGYARLSLPEKQ